MDMTLKVAILLYVLLSAFFTAVAVMEEVYDKRPVTWAQVMLVVLLWPGWVILGTFALSVLVAQRMMIRIWMWLDRPIVKVMEE